MQRTTSVTLGDSLNQFTQNMIDEGRYGSVTEVVRAGLRLLEQEEQEKQLKASLQAGLDSGETEVTLEEIAKRVETRRGL